LLLERAEWLKECTSFIQVYFTRLDECFPQFLSQKIFL